MLGAALYDPVWTSAVRGPATIPSAIATSCIHAEAVASIKFFAPGDRTGVMLREDLGVQAFDVAARSLVVSYAGSARASAFRLTVRGEEATLEVDGRRVVSSFSWEM